MGFRGLPGWWTHLLYTPGGWHTPTPRGQKPLCTGPSQLYVNKLCFLYLNVLWEWPICISSSDCLSVSFTMYFNKLVSVSKCFPSFVSCWSKYSNPKGKRSWDPPVCSQIGQKLWVTSGQGEQSLPTQICLFGIVIILSWLFLKKTRLRKKLWPLPELPKKKKNWEDLLWEGS